MTDNGAIARLRQTKNLVSYPPEPMSASYQDPYGTSNSSYYPSEADLLEQDREYDEFHRQAEEEQGRRDEEEPSTPFEPNSLKCVCFAAVEAEPVEWLWDGYIPLGMLTLIEGPPGSTKSTLCIEIAARLTNPELQYRAGPQVEFHAGNVLFCALEDNVANVVKSRLMAAEVDQSRCHFLPELPNLEEHYEKLEDVIRQNNISLLVIDSLMTLMGRDTNSEAEVRKILMNLKSLAERNNIAIVALRHWAKTGYGNAMYQGGGSIAFSAVARSILCVVPHNDSEQIVSVVKSSIGVEPQSWRYRICDSDVMAQSVSSTQTPKPVGRIEWLGKSKLKANDLVAKYQQRGQPSKVDEAEVFLRSILSSEPIPKREVVEAGKEQGITEASIKRAKPRIPVKCVKDGFQGETKWFIDEPDK